MLPGQAGSGFQDPAWVRTKTRRQADGGGASAASGGLLGSECLRNHPHFLLIAHCPGRLQEAIKCPRSWGTVKCPRPRSWWTVKCPRPRPWGTVRHTGRGQVRSAAFLPLPAPTPPRWRVGFPPGAVGGVRPDPTPSAGCRGGGTKQETRTRRSASLCVSQPSYVWEVMARFRVKRLP